MTATQPKQKLIPQLGIPLTIALQFPGKKVPSRIQGAPDQMYYVLTDGQFMYLPLEVGAIIDRLSLRAGEPFTLCKLGPRDWHAARVDRPRDFHPPLNHEPPPSPVNGAGEDAGRILARCYDRAIAIALDAVENARAKGLLVSPSFEDLRATAATLMISETRGQR